MWTNLTKYSVRGVCWAFRDCSKRVPMIRSLSVRSTVLSSIHNLWDNKLNNLPPYERFANIAKKTLEYTTSMRILKRTVLAQRSNDVRVDIHIARAIETSAQERSPWSGRNTATPGMGSIGVTHIAPVRCMCVLRNNTKLYSVSLARAASVWQLSDTRATGYYKRCCFGTGEGNEPGRDGGQVWGGAISCGCLATASREKCLKRSALITDQLPLASTSNFQFRTRNMESSNNPWKGYEKIETIFILSVAY